MVNTESSFERVNNQAEQTNKKLATLSTELKEFKDEMKVFKDETLLFKDDMGAFKDNMETDRSHSPMFSPINNIDRKMMPSDSILIFHKKSDSSALIIPVQFFYQFLVFILILNKHKPNTFVNRVKGLNFGDWNSHENKVRRPAL